MHRNTSWERLDGSYRQRPGSARPIEAGLVPIKKNPLLRTALGDFHMLIRLMARQPTLCHQLLPDIPDFLGYCDASKLGAGGVWLPCSRWLHPIVWRLEFPLEIRARLVSLDNPTGDITNSDLEMAGIVAQYLVLEHLTSLEGVHAATN